MGTARKFDLDRGLEAYLATLCSSFRSKPPNWQIYASVTGSAMAMLTGASAAIIGNEIQDAAAEPIASVRDAKDPASFRTMPMIHAVRLAMAKQDSGHASQAQAPSISPGGVVPVFGTVNTIQPGEWVSIYGNNLASGNAVWNGDFPMLLGGTSVKINGRAAYLQFVSPGQINLQAPDDTATGTVPGEPEGPHSWGLSKGSREVSARSTSVSDGAIRD